MSLADRLTWDESDLVVVSPRALARENALHRSADTHVAMLEVAIRYAFAKGREAMRPGHDAVVAARAVKAALLDVLPKTLLKVLVAGGNVGLARLMRLKAAEFRVAADFNISFDAENPNAAKWAREHAADLAKGLSETTRDAIKEAVASQFDKGGDSATVYQDILDAVGDESRAALIARHESLVATNEGQRQGWDQAVDAGLLTGDEKRVWIVTDDERLCPICEALDGEMTDLDGEYPGDGGDGPPAHVNCRCTEGIVG